MDEQQAPPTTPAGWYPDPQMAGTQRYWDGRTWTGSVAPMAPASPVLMRPPRNDNGLETGGWICAFLLPIVGVILGIILAARGNNKGIGILVVSIVAMVVLYGALSGTSTDY